MLFNTGFNSYLLIKVISDTDINIQGMKHH